MGFELRQSLGGSGDGSAAGMTFASETWKALRLVMLKGKTVDEAADESGVSTWTIYSARARLMKRLRDELDGLL